MPLACASLLSAVAPTRIPAQLPPPPRALLRRLLYSRNDVRGTNLLPCKYAPLYVPRARTLQPCIIHHNEISSELIGLKTGPHFNLGTPSFVNYRRRSNAERVTKGPLPVDVRKGSGPRLIIAVGGKRQPPGSLQTQAHQQFRARNNTCCVHMFPC
jgi:hypothetical protein